MATDNQQLTTGPIYRHLINLSIPAAMGMVFNTLYNLTDFWFAGMLSNQALAGLSIAGSVFAILVAIGAGMQTGTTAMIASDAGRERYDEVRAWLDNAIGLALVLSVIVLAAGWWVADDLVQFLGAEADVEPLALAYLNVTLIGNAAFMLSSIAAGALMAMGDTHSNRNALAVGFFANFALNPLLTFGLGLGVTGLALATVIIKALSAVYLFYVLRKRLNSRSRPAFAMPRWQELSRQVFPASFNMLTIILGGFITVSFVGRFGSEHVAGYAVGLRLEQVLLLPALGLNMAVMAIVGQNFGVGQIDRLREAYRKGLIIGVVMAACSIPVMVFLSPLMVSFFSDSQTIIDTGATYLRIDAIAFYAYVVLFISVATLQAIKQPLFPMVLGIARQLVLPATINYLLIVKLGYPMVALFITIVSVVVLSSILAAWYTARQLKQLSSAH
jgi:putative MATE family efflux protein